MLLPYWHGGHLVQWGRTIRKNCQYPFHRRPHVKSGENWPAQFQRKRHLKILYTYIVQGQGQITPRGQNFDCN